MATVHILGTSNAVSSNKMDHTCLAVKGSASQLLIECPGSPVQKLLKAGFDPMKVNTLIITHRHPDHIYGLPSFIQTLGLLGRTKKLEIIAPSDTIDLVRTIFDIFDLLEFSNKFVSFHSVTGRESQMILEKTDFLVKGVFVHHSVPTLGIRINNKSTGGSITYSSDTSPSHELASLAFKTNLLIHECTLSGIESSDIHSNGLQAGKIATEAMAKKLLLVHLPSSYANADMKKTINLAEKEFIGTVKIPREYQIFKF